MVWTGGGVLFNEIGSVTAAHNKSIFSGCALNRAGKMPFVSTEVITLHTLMLGILVPALLERLLLHSSLS